MPTTDPFSGIFKNVLRLQGTSSEISAAQQAISKALPVAGIVAETLKLLPEGELKNWLTANPIQFWKKVITLITGRKYTSGAYVLGERLNDQVYGNADIGRQQVSDDMVEVAHRIFSQLFGVRISTSEDLDALDHGVIAYKNRPVSEGISDEAIERAVFLKQRYYPIATYNRVPWDLRYFELYPLVDRIPDWQIGKWYNGTVLGGGLAVEGLIPLSAQTIIQQFPGAGFDPITGETTTPTGEVVSPQPTAGPGTDLLSYVKSNPAVAVAIAAGLGLVIYQVERGGGL